MSAAAKDFRSAIGWYSEQGPRLGAELAREVKDKIAHLQRFPYSGYLLENKIRQTHLSKFPYALIYTLVDHSIVIIAVWHGSRDPDGWKDRI